MQRQPRTLISTEALTTVSLVLAGMYGLSQGFHFWATADIYSHRELLGLTIGSYLAGFACLLLPLVWEPSPRKAGWAVATLVGLTALGRGYHQLRYVNPRYGTDAVAFNHYAAELVLQGKNPYRASMAPASRRFGVPRKYYTPDEKGHVVSELSYPSLSFLIYTPFVAVGLGNVNWINLAFLLAAIFLAMLLAPPWAAPWMPLVFVIEPEFVNFSVGGVTDILFVPLLLGAVWSWDEHKDLAAILWGLACGIKQGPWFLAPFAAVSVAWDSQIGHRWKNVVRFSSIAAAAFLLPNLPFVVSDPAAWFFGVFTPMGRKLVLYGSGLVTLTTTAGLRIPRTAYSLVSLTFLTVLLALFTQYYERVKPLLWLVPALVLWLAPRSFHSYYIYWVPIFALALAYHISFISKTEPTSPDSDDPTSTDDAASDETQTPGPAKTGTETKPPGIARPGPLQKTGAISRFRIPTRWIPILVALPFLMLTALAAWSTTRPLSLTVDKISPSDSGGLGVVTALTLRATNHSQRPLHPRFALAWSHNNFFFWFPDRPVTIPPGKSKRIVIRPKDPTQAPPLDDAFVIRIYDENDPVFHLTQPVRPPARTVGLFNGNFAAWDDVSNQPLSWVRWPSFVAAPGAMTLGRVHGKTALCLRAVQAGGRQQWARTTLEQTVPASVDELGFESVVYAEPEGGMRPRVLAGLELRFPAGETAVVIPQPGLPSPVAYRLEGSSRPLVLLHLSAPADLSKWSVHWVNIEALARYFGYVESVPVTVRLLASRHESRPGVTKICFAWVGARRDPWTVPGSSVAIQQLTSINNPSLRFGDSGLPFGWTVEQPTGCQWSVKPRVGMRPDRTTMKLSLRVEPGKKEWCRLALSQIPIRPTGPISLEVCTNRSTRDPAQPKLIAGIEVSSPRTKTTHVWTLCDGPTRQRSRPGNTRIHCVFADERGCAKIHLDPSKITGIPRPKFALVANVHQESTQPLEVEFSSIELPNWKQHP